jgi:hypothetical protein
MDRSDGTTGELIDGRAAKIRTRRKSMNSKKKKKKKKKSKQQQQQQQDRWVSRRHRT